MRHSAASHPNAGDSYSHEMGDLENDEIVQGGSENAEQRVEFMSDEMKIVPSPRPETQAAEDAYLLRSYRHALTEISHILKMPGSPSLTTDVVSAVRRLTAEDRSRESCDGHEWIVLKAIALTGTPVEHVGSIVPYEWCRLCGAIHHDFLGQKKPGDPFP